MKKTAICNHSENCMIYKNWVALEDNRLNIIEIDTMENRDYFTCLALNATKSGVRFGGIPMTGEMALRLKQEDLNKLECPYIMSLNCDSRLVSRQRE